MYSCFPFHWLRVSTTCPTITACDRLVRSETSNLSTTAAEAELPMRPSAVIPITNLRFFIAAPPGASLGLPERAFRIDSRSDRIGRQDFEDKSYFFPGAAR